MKKILTVALLCLSNYLSIGDNFTADYISKRMPKDIVYYRDQSGIAVDKREKYLLEPSEVMTFPDIITEVRGLDSPVRFPKTPYWEINNNANPNPFR